MRLKIILRQSEFRTQFKKKKYIKYQMNVNTTVNQLKCVLYSILMRFCRYSIECIIADDLQHPTCQHADDLYLE